MTPAEVFAQVYSRTGWRADAECRTARPAYFSPVDGRGRVDMDRAKRIAHVFCGPCPVRDACRGEADVLHGIGLGPQELVQAGAWWPIATAVHSDPVELLPDTHIHEEEAA